MRTLVERALALLGALFLVIGLLAVPSADAQTIDPYADPLSLEDPIVCGGDFYGRISGGQSPYELGYELDGPAEAIFTLPPFAVAAAGPYKSPPGYVAGLPDGVYTVIVTLTDDIGQIEVKTFIGSLQAICVGGGAVVPGAVGPGVANNADAGDDGEGADAIPGGAGQPIAVTGSNVNTPIAIGFSLVGAGGLALLIARRRESPDEELS